MSKLIHADLTYAIRGVLFDVYNQLGPLLPEQFYQKAVAIGLTKKGIDCQRERGYQVYYRNQRVGLYYVDVWVDGGKVILELKVAPEIEPLHRAQAISYLKVTNADLALVVNFGAEQLQVERLPNFVRDRQAEFEWHPRLAPETSPYPELVNQLLQAIHRVHHELGPGFLHQVYRRATLAQLMAEEIPHTYIRKIPLTYQGESLGDKEVYLIQISDKLILAVMAVKEITTMMKKQFRARLKHLGFTFGLLANFHRTALGVTTVSYNG